MSISGTVRAGEPGMRMLLITGAFMAAVGAFGTSMAPLLVRLPYWLAVLAIGGGLLLGGRFWIERWGGGFLAGYRADCLAAAVTAPVIALVVILASRIAFPTHLRTSGLPRLILSILMVSAALLALRRAVLREAATAEPLLVASVNASKTRFHDRLPFGMRSARIIAIEADDHYLRVHTEAGQAYLHMRLGDAVLELAGVDGMRVHRSWWVARSAVASARWRHGRGTLRLADGRDVPVSRTYASRARSLI